MMLLLVSLKEIIRYQVEKYGKRFITVDPRNTSKTGSLCMSC
jgi:transposase